MKKTTRKLIKRVSTIEVPGFPLPMILVHGLEAQTMLGEQMIQGVAPLDGEGKAHRLLLAARAELLAGVQDQARADVEAGSPPAPQPSLFLAATAAEGRAVRRPFGRTAFLPGPRPAPIPPAPPEGTRFSLLEID